MYRERHLKTFDPLAGKALRNADTHAWAAWLNTNWPRYKEFCLQYAALLDRTPRMTQANKSLDADTKERVRVLFQEARWQAKDNWNEEEQGWFPDDPFHYCADHLLDRHRLCGKCRQPLAPLETFVQALFDAHTPEDPGAIYDAIERLSWSHACRR